MPTISLPFLYGNAFLQTFFGLKDLTYGGLPRITKQLLTIFRLHPYLLSSITAIASMVSPRLRHCCVLFFERDCSHVNTVWFRSCALRVGNLLFPNREQAPSDYPQNDEEGKKEKKKDPSSHAIHFFCGCPLDFFYVRIAETQIPHCAVFLCR